MAAQKSGIGVRLNGRFSPGTKVSLFERHGTQFDRAHVGNTLARGKVDQQGSVEFLGLQAKRSYWVAAEIDGEWRAVQMTAKEQPAQKQRLSSDAVGEKLAQTRPPASAVRASTPVTGARSTTDARVVAGVGAPFAHQQVGKPTPKADREDQPAPYARIEDVSDGTPLRSHTVTGEAHVVNPDLPDGKLRQDQVPDGMPQASSTPLGEATIIGDEDQALARLENKVPVSAAAGGGVKTPGIDAAVGGKVPAEAKRAAEGKKPEASKAKKPTRRRPAKKASKSTSAKPKAAAKPQAPRKASPKKR